MAQDAGIAIQDAEVKAKLADMGAAAVGGSPAQTAAFHRKEMAKFKRAVEISGATADMPRYPSAISSPAMRPSANDCARPLPGR